jgi:hypothetical protein
LTVTPPVHLLEVERCVVGMQQAVVDLGRKGNPPQPINAVQDAEALSHDSVGQRDAKRFSLADLKKAARRIVLGDRRFERIEQLENAVTAQVPLDLVDALGDSALTVFTAGLPYSFVKSARADWSDKQIGHIVSDADLLVINELHNLGSIDPLISFNLIVDSGHFRNSETDDVPRSCAGVQATRLFCAKTSRWGCGCWRFLARCPPNSYCSLLMASMTPSCWGTGHFRTTRYPSGSSSSTGR